MVESRVAQFLNSPSKYVSTAHMPIGARGYTVYYADGSSALCGTSGVWNVALGYGNRRIADAIYRAALDASYLSNFRTTNSYAEAAADSLLELPRWDFDGVLFATSGSAAVDACIKLTRAWAALGGAADKRIIVSVRGSYHGMTLSAMAVGGQELGQRMHSVNQGHVRFVGPNDADGFVHLVELLGDRICAVIVEPVLGSGTICVSEELIMSILRYREKYGYLVIADEVATGFWRTGPLFVSDQWPSAPDLLILSKALTNGSVAASAILLGGRVNERHLLSDVPLYHAETQAGTPTSCAAISATITEFREQGAQAKAAKTADTLGLWLDHLLRDYPSCWATGRGCFRSIHLRTSEGETVSGDMVMSIVEAVRTSGATVYPGPSAIQFVPALNYDPVTFERYLEVVDGALRAEFSVIASSI